MYVDVEVPLEAVAVNLYPESSPTSYPLEVNVQNQTKVDQQASNSCFTDESIIRRHAI
jgi:hypothetical protein